MIRDVNSDQCPLEKQMITTNGVLIITIGPPYRIKPTPDIQITEQDKFKLLKDINLSKASGQ